MRQRHMRKPQRLRMSKIVLAALLAVMLSVGSVVTVMANTVDVTVRDGEDTYAFSMLGANPEDILARAETEGMPPVSSIDTYAFSDRDGILTVQRFVRVSVAADGEAQTYVVPKGTTLSDALDQNGVELGARDVTEPALDTALTADTVAVVTRSNRVFVEADGARSMVDVLGGTVGEALRAAGITLGEKDTVTPAADTQLENGMRIHVARYLDVTIMADGETVQESVAAHSVGEAVEKAGVALGEADRLYRQTENGEHEVGASDAIADGDVIRVVRITTEEVTETETIEYKTTYEDTDSLYEGETETKTNGAEGEKRVTYKVTYADGEETGREPIEEEILKEARDAVVLRGTKERPAAAPGNGDGASNTAATGTFVDASGSEVGYEYSLSGSCTAYYAEEGAVTSTGAKPQVGYVAVNPNIIPYGSLLYITSADGSWTYGYCYAMDTGGGAMAGSIVADLYYDTYEECIAFGRRNMVVYVIRSGW